MSSMTLNVSHMRCNVTNAKTGEGYNEQAPNEIADGCEKCIAFYEERPGYAGTGTIIDLYRTIARLARIIEEQQTQLECATHRATMSKPLRKLWACWRCNWLNDWDNKCCGMCGQKMRGE